LITLLTAYVATLIWMRRMANGRPMPRFLDAEPAQPVAGVGGGR